MDLCIIGVGYVGLATAAVLANLGRHVFCVDADATRIECLRKGECPIHEPGLRESLCSNLENGRLSFTTDTPAAVHAADIVFIAVGTPVDANNCANLFHLRAAALDIASALNGPKLIVNKSTVPVGTGNLLAQIIRDNAPFDIGFDFCSNPEFLREGCALQDTLKPDRIIIGANDRGAAQKLVDLYAPLQRPIIITDIAAAEMIKYASNAFLATKISFINAIADICELVGADVSVVAEGMGLDPRIGPEFLKPGLGYGGSCLPKDAECFISSATAAGYDFSLLRAVQEVNDARVSRFVERMETALSDLRGKTIGVLGLAFKPNTDDLRDSRAVELVAALLDRGATVKAHDPVAMPKCAVRLPQVHYVKNPYEAARDADALVIATEWDEFKALDLERIRDLMARPVIFDGRNVYDPKSVRALGFRYHSVGRP